MTPEQRIAILEKIKSTLVEDDNWREKNNFLQIIAKNIEYLIFLDTTSGSGIVKVMGKNSYRYSLDKEGNINNRVKYYGATNLYLQIDEDEFSSFFPEDELDALLLAIDQQKPSRKNN